jgi:hypothetical protein
MLAVVAPGGTAATRPQGHASHEGGCHAEDRGHRGGQAIHRDITGPVRGDGGWSSSHNSSPSSDRVASTWDVSDLEAFQAARSAASPELAAAMERYGMIPPVTIYIEKSPDPGPSEGGHRLRRPVGVTTGSDSGRVDRP